MDALTNKEFVEYSDAGSSGIPTGNPMLFDDTTCMKINLQHETFEDLDKALVLIKCYSKASDPFRPGLDRPSFTACLIKNSIALNDTLITDTFIAASPEDCGGIQESSDPGKGKIYPTQYQVNILMPIFHWKLGLRWLPNANEINKKNQ